MLRGMGILPTQTDFDDGEKSAAEVIRRASENFPSIRFRPEDMAHPGAIVRGWFVRRMPQPDMVATAGERFHFYDLHHAVTLGPMLYFGLLQVGALYNCIGGRAFDAVGGEYVVGALRTAEEMQTMHPGGRQFAMTSVRLAPEWLAAHPEFAELQHFFSDHLAFHRGRASAEMLRAAQRMNALIHERSLVGRLHFEAATLDFIAVMTEALSPYCTAVIPPFQPQTQIPAETVPVVRRMEKLREWLEALRPGEAITLASLARAFGASESTLSRQFRAAYGTSIMQYLTRHRLEMARTALENEEMSVAEAAYLAGFSGPANFTTAFKRAFGMTPGQVRHRIVAGRA